MVMDKYNGRSVSFNSEYLSWKGMRTRCSNRNNKRWIDYGGRGVTVCDRWQNDFDAFLNDMGPKPTPQHTIDRFPDVDGNYEPSNCRWATPTQQARNRRDNRILTFNGQSLCVSEWAKQTQLSWNTINSRLERGWTVEETLNTPGTLKKPHIKQRSNVRVVTIGNETLTVLEWSERYHISLGTIRSRLLMGWDEIKAISTPSRPYHGHNRHVASIKRDKL